MRDTILLAAVNAKYIHSNLAVYSLRAYAAEYRDRIGLAEYTINNRMEQILQDIYKRRPKVLCFSCYIWNVSLVCRVAEEFHKLCPAVPIWMGGPEVSYETEDFLEEHPFVTGIMMGEGERIFRNLCAFYLEKRGRLEEMRGIAIRREGGCEIHEPEEPLDMDELPFCYEDMEDFSNRIIYYETSRGCPFRCSYCLSSVEKRLRFRSLELVRKELQFFLDHKVPQVKFVDRTFNCRREHALAIWSYIREHDNGFTNFHFEIAADLMTEEETELIRGMRPGLIQLEIGVQTTNPVTIDEIHRRMDLPEVKRIVGRIRQQGNIHQHLDLIAGLPYEDYLTFAASFDEIYALRPDQLQLGFLKVLKGSYMYEHAGEYGLVYQSEPPYEVLQTRWLTYDDICRIKLAEEMLELYYNSAQFPMSVCLLEQSFSSPYRMFEELGHFYEEKGYLSMNHSRNRRAEILLEFVGQRVEQADMEAFRQAAVYDIYSRENAKSRPAWAADPSEWKAVSRAWYRKGKQSHVERFTYRFPADETGLMEDDGKQRLAGEECEPYYLLFDYEKRDARNHQARITRLYSEEQTYGLCCGGSGNDGAASEAGRCS